MTSSTASLALSSAMSGSYLIIRRNGKPSPVTKTTIITLKSTSFHSSLTAARRMVSCQAVSTASLDEDEKDASVSGSAVADEEAKVGDKVKVKVPLKVYHVPRVSEVDLTGMEGVIKQYVGIWKGKRISANFPYKVEFFKEIEGRGSVKIIAHLKEEELEFLD